MDNTDFSLAGCTPQIPLATPLAEQPTSTEIHMADGIFVKTMHLPHKGNLVGQHSHSFAHVSVLVKGGLRVWRDGVYVGEFLAPIGITIPAHVKHTFEALVDGTAVLCVHDIGCADEVVIDAEHHLAMEAA